MEVAHLVEWVIIHASTSMLERVAADKTSSTLIPKGRYSKLLYAVFVVYEADKLDHGVPAGRPHCSIGHLSGIWTLHVLVLSSIPASPPFGEDNQAQEASYHRKHRCFGTMSLTMWSNTSSP